MFNDQDLQTHTVALPKQFQIDSSYIADSEEYHGFHIVCQVVIEICGHHDRSDVCLIGKYVSRSLAHWHIISI